jgi:hypothetical protein
LARGETEAAISWASSYKGEIQDRIYPSIAIALAKVRLVQERPDEALKLLEHALTRLTQLVAWVVIQILVRLVHQRRAAKDGIPLLKHDLLSQKDISVLFWMMNPCDC